MPSEAELDGTGRAWATGTTRPGRGQAPARGRSAQSTRVQPLPPVPPARPSPDPARRVSFLPPSQSPPSALAYRRTSVMEPVRSHLRPFAPSEPLGPPPLPRPRACVIRRPAHTLVHSQHHPRPDNPPAGAGPGPTAPSLTIPSPPPANRVRRPPGANRRAGRGCCAVAGLGASRLWSHIRKMSHTIGLTLETGPSPFLHVLSLSRIPDHTRPAN